jgi:enamine deaminase RidA (YjgF/YER057c/UK114 family)
MIYTSGTIGREEDGSLTPDFAHQVRRSLDELERLLVEAGGALETVLKATVFLTEQSQFAEMNAIYRERFSDPLPARSTVVVGMAVPDLLFEIEAIAHVK